MKMKYDMFAVMILGFFFKLLTDILKKYSNAPLTAGVLFCNFKKYFTWEIEVTL